MTLDDLDRALAPLAVAPDLDAELAPAIADSVAYLDSDLARRRLADDIYWPKWDGPWWHMLALFELGAADRIPRAMAEAMVARFDALPLKFFPIQPEVEAPGAEMWRAMCHCAIGSMYQVLAACGIEVDAALPWLRTWLPRYQMADGGLSCDESAYLVEHECPSSMVGTIAAFEAMLIAPPGDDRTAFLDRGAAFLIDRALVRGSSTVHNAEERDAAPAWRLPCFPRFYFYDVLRGLAALARWATLEQKPLPLAAISDVVAQLSAAFPDGAIRVQRHGYAVCPQGWAADDAGVWGRRPTTTFALLDAASALGRPSGALTRQWARVRTHLRALRDAGRIA